MLFLLLLAISLSSFDQIVNIFFRMAQIEEVCTCDNLTPSACYLTTTNARSVLYIRVNKLPLMNKPY